MSGYGFLTSLQTEALVKMETLFCLVSPPRPKLSSFKLFSVSTTTPITLSSLSSSPNPNVFSSKKLHSKPTTKTPASSTSTILNTNGSSVSSPPKKVLVPIGYGTEEMEAVVLVDVFRRAGAEVVVASVEPQLEIEAAGGIRLVADTDISTCTDEIFDLVALPGGMPGSARLRDSDSLRQITSKQAEEKRLYGAICAAPAITLLPWGLLKRKQTTCHPAFKDMLPTFWAVSSNIQVSEELTTSRGPGTSFEFALCLVDQLFGESVAGQVGELLLINTADDKHRNEEFNKVEWSFDHNPRALIPIANGFEQIEVVTIVDILRRANVDVVVASTEKSEQVLASQRIKIVADKLISDAAESIYDLIILPGEVAGSERLHKSKVLKKLLQEQNTSQRVYGAVGSSLAVLHIQGLLKGKRVTAHPSVETELMNGVVNGTKVVIDGKLITSRGLATVVDFALAIVSKLFGHARARSVAEGLVLEYPTS